MARSRATHLKVLTRCEQKWLYERGAGDDEWNTVATLVGTRVHLRLAEYLKDGSKPDQQERYLHHPVGLIADSMIGPWLPPPGKGAVEDPFEMKLEGGHTLTGTIDWHSSLKGGKAWWIIDHKTSSDPEAWGLTVDTLKCDLQHLVYAYSRVHLFGVQRVLALWNYGARFRKAPLPGKRVLISTSADELRIRFQEHVLPLLSRMDEIDAGSPAKRNYEACNDYNKECPHMDRCLADASAEADNLIT